MKTKRTIKVLLSGFIMAGCFMIAQQASAQGWGDGAGIDQDHWCINKDDSNNWGYLRIQTSTDRGWNIVNQGYLWWGFDTSDDHYDRGNEKMRLTTGGLLSLTAGSDLTLSSGGNLMLGESDDLNLILDSNEIMARNDGAISPLYLQGDGGDISIYKDRSESEKFIIKDGGSVGIGTSSPSEKLHVSGGKIRLEGGSNTYLSVNETSSGDESRFWTHTDGELYLQNNNGIAFAAIDNASIYARFLSNGNFGIGTDSPSDKLTVYDGELALQTDDNTEDQGLLFQNSSGAYTWRMYRTDAGSHYADLKFATGLNSDFTQLTDVMILQEDGNVGIGTVSPSEKLEVDGTVKATSFVSSAASFPDYVFAANYEITPLSELETYVTRHSRLPGMPSEKEVVEQGLNMPEVVVKSVENIETIYLHLIRMEKEIKTSQEQIKALQQENARLKQQLSNRR